jgi:hypothetical protein
MERPPCQNPEFREQIRRVHMFIYNIIMAAKKNNQLSAEDDQIIALTLATMKTCEKCILDLSKE